MTSLAPSKGDLVFSPGPSQYTQPLGPPPHGTAWAWPAPMSPTGAFWGQVTAGGRAAGDQADTHLVGEER